MTNFLTKISGEKNHIIIIFLNKKIEFIEKSMFDNHFYFLFLKSIVKIF